MNNEMVNMKSVPKPGAEMNLMINTNLVMSHDQAQDFDLLTQAFKSPPNLMNSQYFGISCSPKNPAIKLASRSRNNSKAKKSKRNDMKQIYQWDIAQGNKFSLLK